MIAGTRSPLHCVTYCAVFALIRPIELVDWIQGASKAEVAALANEFLDEDGSRLTLQAASFLAMDCEAVARKLGLDNPDIALVGGLLTKHKRFRAWVTHRLRCFSRGPAYFVPKRESAIGALLLAGGGATQRIGPVRQPSLVLDRTAQSGDDGFGSAFGVAAYRHDAERRSPVIPVCERTNFDCAGVNDIVRAFQHGGRLFYVGAGTSGRLGVLDASECPPTFSTDPEMVQAIIAGGATALHTAVEGAEDDPEAGAEAVRVRDVGRRDVVIGIAASGSTPFVLGALDEASAKREDISAMFLSAAIQGSRGAFFQIGAGSDYGFDATEGRDGHQACAEHADDDFDDSLGQGCWQPDGGRETDE